MPSVVPDLPEPEAAGDPAPIRQRFARPTQGRVLSQQQSEGDTRLQQRVALPAARVVRSPARPQHALAAREPLRRDSDQRVPQLPKPALPRAEQQRDQTSGAGGVRWPRFSQGGWPWLCSRPMLHAGFNGLTHVKNKMRNRNVYLT